MPDGIDKPDAISRLPLLPNGGVEPDETPPNVAITEPGERAQVAAGSSVTVKGTATDAQSGVRSVACSLDGGAYTAATRVGTTWSAGIPIPSRGNHVVRVLCIDGEWNESTAARNLVGIDTTPPELLVDQPGAEVTGAVVGLVARARDTDPSSNVKAVYWSLDGVNFREAFKSGESSEPDKWPIWTADMTLPSLLVPANGTPYTLTVRAYNLDDRLGTKQVSFRAVDRTPPRLEIINPTPDVKEILGTTSGGIVQLRGTASDTHDATKLYSGVDRVEYALDGGTFIQVIPRAPGDWSTWSANVPIPAHDEHTITVRCIDKQGNATLSERRFVVALPFEVKDLGAKSYLKDLLDFAARRLRQADQTDVEPRLLANTFHQPFAGLVSATGEAGSQLVHQIRLCIEVLRDYLNARPTPTAHWAFDEGGGAVALDSSGNGNVGTLQGPTRTAGRTGGGALQFDGVDDVVKLDGASYGNALNNFTVTFWTNPQAAHEIDVQSTSGTSGTSGQKYTFDPQHGSILYGSLEHACAGVSVGTNGISVYEHSDSYMPALLVHQAPISGWTHVAVVYENKQPRLYVNGTLVKTGLTSPKRFVHLNPLKLGGMSYGYFSGQLDDVRIYDRTLSEVEVRDLFSPLPAGEVVWVEDALPASATVQAEGGDTWNWVSTNPAPFSGTKSHQSNVAAGVHQHSFTGATAPLTVKRGDRLFAHVYLDQSNVPEEVMLQWNDGTWEHRAYWGANKIPSGTDVTDSRRYMGPLPPAGKWVKLEVAASQVGLENRVLSGMAFTLYGGRATWDRAGKTGYGAALAGAEGEYRQTAYQALLGGFGVSYEEVRLARVAEKPTREALADRLGIELGPTRPDRLDRLFLQLDQITEADLERLFGLASTTRGPLESGTAAEPELLSWQLERLHTLWKQQDRPIAVGAELPPPIVDPDLIGRDDLQNPLPGDPAFDLWDARRKDVDGWITNFRTKRVSKTTALEGFDLIVGEELAPLNLPALAEERRKGVDIEARLMEKQLSLAAFDYLVRVRNLASAGSVLASEWEDVYSILAQVRKLRSHADWREKERLKDLTLGPDHFKVPEVTAPPTRLPAWRAPERARRAWQNTLRARMDQQQSIAQALWTTVDAAEEAALPLLRNALVAAIGAGRTDIDVAEALTRRLLIDVKSSGHPKTTRIDQAVETLQSVLFALRAGHFKERAAMLGPNPAAAWVLEQRPPQYVEQHFDQELKWMGSQGTWRAAMFAFLYPENLLIPSLREDSTPAFRDLVANLRKTQGLTPEQARDVAKDYLTSVPVLSEEFEITEQLDEAQLNARRDWVATLSGRPDLQTAQSQTYLKEVFFFVPLQLALQLQQSGEYLTALDWFQTVYAYNLPTGQRKIYEPLKLDPAQPKSVNRTIEWLLNSLNPHRVAVTRANAYTRFTLLSLARCFLEYADAEFARDTDESLPRARALYMNAMDLLDLPEMQQTAAGTMPTSDTFPTNPLPQALRRRAELNLFKLRTGRNFAGMQRQMEPPAQGAETTNGLPRAATLQPTPYYYSVLIERAKQLVNISQQLEAAYLSALEKTDAENYSLLQANHGLNLAKANVDLQKLREKEAADGEELANRQRSRAQIEASTYKGWIDGPPNRYEEALLQNYKDMRQWRNTIAGMDAALTFAQTLTSASEGGFLGTGLGLAPGLSVLVGALAVTKAGFTAALNNAETQAQVNSLRASQELRKQEWELRSSVAEQDLLIGDQQIQLAKDHLLIVGQEYDIAQMQTDQARTVADFLANKFTNADLYEWMSGVLGQVYGYFLRQSTAVAQLAQNQLAFERQEIPPSFIQADYWQPPSESFLDGVPSTNGATDEKPDRRGLTGSARLLQDIYQLDQHAFETNKRKHQLTQTFSLAQLAPFEFQRFRETGRLAFATPMEKFDRAFPGHYLRLVHRVRTSVVALVPPTQGVKATLSASGVSRVVTGGDVFQSVVVRRDPEIVALSSPTNATGLFELDPQSEMLRPFEAMGVDTSWEFQMPKAANPFDFRTIADVLITIEYTALNSLDYRQQIVQGLDGSVSADRPFSLREQFRDLWYDLHNPEGTATPMTIRFTTTRDDFPPNLEELVIQHLVLFFVRADGVTSELRVDHLFLRQGNSMIEAGEVTSVNGIISTRGGNGANWASMKGGIPVGEWELALADQTKPLFEEEKIEDILFVITYSGSTPEWPI
jgi:hypothetical protein